jgi:hypothetical protein
MAYDFRANQVRVEKFIVSSALGAHRLLIYPVDAASNLQGGITSTVFNTSAIGLDVFFYVSGAKGSLGGTSPQAAVFGGDLLVSGNLKLLAGVSGSLQRLSSGIPYMIGNSGINIVTNSLGQIEVSSSVIASDPSPWKESGGTQIQTTSSVSITGNALFFATNAGADVYFYVSGSSTKKAVFGDELIISGNVRALNKFSAGGSAYFSSSVTTLGSLVSSGNFIASAGMSGSLQSLSDGTPAFIAGPNITIDILPTGATAISGSSSGGGGPILNNLSTATILTGSGMASVNTGTGAATVSYGLGQTGAYQPGNYTGPRVLVRGIVPFGTDVRVYGRVASITGGDNTTFLKFGLVGESNNRFLYCRIRADTLSYGAYNTGGAVVNIGNLVGDGQDWVAVERRGGTVVWWYGRGTTTTPPANGTWTWVYTVADTFGPDASLAIALAGNNGVSAAATMDYIYVEGS